MSSSGPAIRVSGLSKTYAIYRRPEHRLLQSLLRGRKRLYREFHALRDVSFDVEPGETVGILGRNGSGKSTLLQLIAGTLTPTAGSVAVRGRSSAILELGAGFNLEFTGRENLVVSAAVAGMTADEAVSRMAAMIRFADLGDFIDQPVKTYSSGMHARLAFAAAIHVNPDVLIVDEALAVGDARFQAQCFRKFDEFRKRGVTILFVSHSVDQIARHCSRALLLEGGVLVRAGEPRPVIAHYLELLFGTRPATAPAPPGADTTSTAAPGDANAKSVLSSAAATGAADATPGIPAPPAADDGALPAHIARYFGPDAREAADRFATRPGYNRLEHRWGDARARIIDHAVAGGDGQVAPSIATGEAATLFIRVRFSVAIAQPIYGMTIKTPDGVEVTGNNSRDGGGLPVFVARAAGERVVIRFDFECRLNAGDYLVSVGVAEDGDAGVLPLDRRYDSIVLHVRNARKSFGLVDLGIRAQEVGDGDHGRAQGAASA